MFSKSFLNERTDEEMINDKIKIGVKYLIRINAHNNPLVYTGFILGYCDKWLFIKDKYNKPLILPIHLILSMEEQDA